MTRTRTDGAIGSASFFPDWFLGAVILTCFLGGKHLNNDGFPGQNFSFVAETGCSTCEAFSIAEGATFLEVYAKFTSLR